MRYTVILYCAYVLIEGCLSSCTVFNKKSNRPHFGCSICDSLVAKGPLVAKKKIAYILYRDVVPLPSRSKDVKSPAKNIKDYAVDTVEVELITEKELFEYEKTLFCLFGESDQTIEKYFPSLTAIFVTDRERVYKQYSFKLGVEYINGTRILIDTIPRYEIEGIDRGSGIWVNESQLTFKFERVGSKLIYIGTGRDSMNLKKCISK